MLITCYRSYLPYTEQDPMSVFVQRVKGWMSIGMYSVDYYIREDFGYILYMFDPKIHRLPNQDYID